jgi:hypothetical protein
MPLVLTTNALVQCVHGGPGTTTPLSPIWTVNGGFVTGEGDTGVLACPFILLPCVGYTLTSMNLNATQRDGEQVILVTDFQQSFTGLPLTITDFHQTYDNSTPAPVPSGQSAPPATPAMADLISPTGSASPPTIPFNSTTMLPAVVMISFTMVTDHPMLWTLRLITATGLNFDITSGGSPELPGLTVSPSGGSWPSPMLSVTVIIPALTVKTFGSGTSYLYLTGVSQRGLNGHAEAQINVT